MCSNRPWTARRFSNRAWFFLSDALRGSMLRANIGPLFESGDRLGEQDSSHVVTGRKRTARSLCLRCRSVTALRFVAARGRPYPEFPLCRPPFFRTTSLDRSPALRARGQPGQRTTTARHDIELTARRRGPPGGPIQRRVGVVFGRDSRILLVASRWSRDWVLSLLAPNEHRALRTPRRESKE